MIRGRDTDEYDGRIITAISDAKKLCGYEIETGHRFFCGIPIETNYVKSSKRGLFGKRFVNLKEEIGDFADAADVAQKLSGRQWE